MSIKEEKISDCWQTPQKLFDELNEEYGPFDIDLAATRENSKCDSYYIDYLNNIIGHQVKDYVRELPLSEVTSTSDEDLTCFLNPPYSNPLPFIQKAWEDSKHCKIVLLVKVDTSTKWWSVFWDYEDVYDCPNCGVSPETVCLSENSDGCYCAVCKHETYDREDWKIKESGPKPGCSYKFLPKRVQFDPPPEMNVWKEGDSWYVKCNKGDYTEKGTCYEYRGDNVHLCRQCKGKGKKRLAGPSFASAVLVFDRREL